MPSSDFEKRQKISAPEEQNFFIFGHMVKIAEEEDPHSIERILRPTAETSFRTFDMFERFKKLEMDEQRVRVVTAIANIRISNEAMRNQIEPIISERDSYMDQSKNRAV